jgi:hypothetical protein
MPKRYSLAALLATMIALIGCGGAPTAPNNLSGANSKNQLTAASMVQFGAVPVGQTGSNTVAVSNTASDGSNVTVSNITVSGPGFQLGSIPPLPIELSPGESVTLGIEFSPILSGSALGKVSILSNATNSLLPVSLTGNGNTGSQITVSPATLNFGGVELGSSGILSGVLIAGNSSVTVTTVDQTGDGYSLGGISFPVTLSPGQQVPFTVTFTPQTSGTSAGSLSFVTDASATPTATLTGSSGGGQASGHGVNLSWGASASPVLGYNIYRGLQSGGPYAKLTGSPEPSTSYSDNTTQSGTTYYYVATSVNNSLQESGYSNQTVASVP